jgi:NADH-dependent peroxiredoxin subunit F
VKRKITIVVGGPMPLNIKGYDLVIIGLGPAGVAAAIYAGREKIKTLVLGEQLGGQSAVSTNIQNWIGTPSMSGADMAAGLAEHLAAVQEDVTVHTGAVVTALAKVAAENKTHFRVTTETNDEYAGSTVLIASGARRRKLAIPGEEKFLERGVSYCTTCDAPLMFDNKVAVIGGGNAGLDAVIDLLPYASQIYLMEITDQIRGEKKIRDMILHNDKTTVLLNAKPVEILGEKSVTGLVYEDVPSKGRRKLALEAIFVAIGSIPNSEFARDLVEVNTFGEIIVDPLSGRTSQTGIWAAGDVTSLPYKQNNIAMGDAVRALLNLRDYLLRS